jgi:hypothetical protein
MPKQKQKQQQELAGLSSLHPTLRKSAKDGAPEIFGGGGLINGSNNSKGKSNGKSGTTAKSKSNGKAEAGPSPSAKDDNFKKQTKAEVRQREFSRRYR